MTDALATAGARAVAEALRLWSLDVYDPKSTDKTPQATASRAVIEDIIRACGWDFVLPYDRNGKVEWCGLFAGACWRVAGLDQRWLATYWASTYRLDTWARYRDFGAKRPNPRPQAGPYRLLAELTEQSTSLPFEPSAGDVLMIGDGYPAMGDHVCLVERYDAKRRVFYTVEGNGVGLGPDGRRREGIVRGERRLGGGGFCARRLIRPALLDLGPVA